MTPKRMLDGLGRNPPAIAKPQKPEIVFAYPVVPSVPGVESDSNSRVNGEIL